MQVDVTNKCNLSCIFCSRTSLEFGEISPRFFPEIINLSKKSRDLILFGYGEPLISEAFHSLFKEAKSGRVSFTTNGLLLNQDKIDRIFKETNRPVYNVTFSIDGVNPQTYLTIRQKSDFNQVWNNLKKLSEYKNRSNLNWPEIWINFVAMKRNLEELPLLVEKASEMEVSQVNVYHVNVWEDSYMEESLIYYPELTRQVFSKAKEKALELGVRLDVPVELAEKKPNGPEKIFNSSFPKCYQPWSYSYIRNDGLVLACCFSENFIMGDLKEKCFEEIWNDKPYQKLRADVNRTLLPDCRKCELRFRYVSSPNDFETYIKLKQRSH